MTPHKKLMEENRAVIVQKLIAATIEPVTVMQIVEMTDLTIGYVRLLMQLNKKHFTCVGRSNENGMKTSKLWQSTAVCCEVATESETQVIYPNPYDQLMQTPNFIARQFGQLIPTSLTHNARASNKSARVFAGGNVLA